MTGPLRELSREWGQARGQTGKIRMLAILREAYRWAHSEKSRIMARTPYAARAKGTHATQVQQAQADTELHDLHLLEERLTLWITRDLGKVSFDTVTSRNPGPKDLRTKRESSDSLDLLSIPGLQKEAWVRPDRIWEKALAETALGLGWELWTVEGWLKLTDAESVHSKLERALWPSGVVLFVESANLSALRKSDEWMGRWWIVTSDKSPGDHPSLKQLEFQKKNDSPVWQKFYAPS